MHLRFWLRLCWQDYDKAKLLKEAETQLKSLGQQLAQLEVAKREAVEDEDYDRAKMLKVRAKSNGIVHWCIFSQDVWKHRLHRST